MRAFGTEVCREDAFVVAALFFVFMNVKIFDLLFRLSELPYLLDNATLRRGLSTIALHSFVANPFGYFGRRIAPPRSQARRRCPSHLLWWGANISLLTFVPPSPSLGFFFIIFLFLAVGLASLFVIYRFYKSVERKLREQGLYSDWWSDSRSLRYLLATVACLIGIVLALCVLCANMAPTRRKRLLQTQGLRRMDRTVATRRVANCAMRVFKATLQKILSVAAAQKVFH